MQLPNEIINFHLRRKEHHASEEHHNSVNIHVSQAVITTWWTREICQSGAKLATLPFNLPILRGLFFFSTSDGL